MVAARSVHLVLCISKPLVHKGTLKCTNAKIRIGGYVASLCGPRGCVNSSSIPGRIHRTAGGGFYTCADTKHKKVARLAQRKLCQESTN